MATIEELDALLEEIDKLEKSGNWTEDRKEILKNLTHEEAMADIMRLQAAHPERLLTPEQIEAMRTERAQPAKRRVEMAGA
ncbi:MAG: hypothetical protein LBC59_01405 [Chitinispirillales bacterium]|jgi:hypothetical protein|nr:hypothetical protein [Chitinispirillales bacterium]